MKYILAHIYNILHNIKHKLGRYLNNFLLVEYNYNKYYFVCKYLEYLNYEPL